MMFRIMASFFFSWSLGMWYLFFHLLIPSSMLFYHCLSWFNCFFYACYVHLVIKILSYVAELTLIGVELLLLKVGTILFYVARLTLKSRHLCLSRSRKAFSVIKIKLFHVKYIILLFFTPIDLYLYTIFSFMHVCLLNLQGTHSSWIQKEIS